jgi:hypothetical protein
MERMEWEKIETATPTFVLPREMGRKGLGEIFTFGIVKFFTFSFILGD